MIGKAQTRHGRDGFKMLGELIFMHHPANERSAAIAVVIEEIKTMGTLQEGFVEEAEAIMKDRVRELEDTPFGIG